ncbi:methanethiol S-methyltransferase [Glacieibacterium frigidum]|uniref:methanethiol S-methyltransferase n=1 Tax=Glacieibacterium frigidum TaxID=2593303 RepID=A0A552U8Y0_9SPHN|nr:methanethiol S-methyltransferase [Glacieibacterium frigidum]TRW14639.1 isoprenylcysteine carboxylmethyltransferase family protein [Glacieibacterium frigidum]
MPRPFYLAFAVAAYAVFFATFLYLIGFVAGLPGLPRTIDTGPVVAVPVAAAIDLGLIALFGAQHSLMARPAFKRAWTRTVPEPIERSVYVLIASLLLILLMTIWHPIPGDLWRVEGTAALVLWVVCGIGWGLVLLSTFLLNHFELFGLRQAYFHLRGRLAGPAEFHQPLLYRIVRHPLYLGFIIAFWATPAMSWGHLLFAAGMTAYILIAIPIEERDLVAALGPAYEDYQRRVGALVPGVGRRAS